MQNLQQALQRHCGEEKKSPIYDVTEFFNFCSLAGAANVFNFILSCMTSSRHSEERILLNQKRTVVILYQLCFGYSQKCNFFQADNRVYFLSFAILLNVVLRLSGSWGQAVQAK